MKTRHIALAAPLLVAFATLVLTPRVQAWWWQDDEVATGPVTELQWEDLLPSDFEPPTDPFATMSQDEIDKILDGSPESNARLAELEAAFRYAPTDPELDGRRVRIPGYVVPLDFDGQTELEEFLLVPYFGACIHTPPPPANQVVHVKAEQAVTIDNTYEPIWAMGTLHTDTVNSALAEAGYRLELDSIEAYVTPTE